MHLKKQLDGIFYIGKKYPKETMMNIITVLENSADDKRKTKFAISALAALDFLADMAEKTKSENSNQNVEGKQGDTDKTGDSPDL